MNKINMLLIKNIRIMKKYFTEDFMMLFGIYTIILGTFISLYANCFVNGNHPNFVECFCLMAVIFMLFFSFFMLKDDFLDEYEEDED